MPGRDLVPRGRLVLADFFARPSDVVAPELIGKILWREGVGGGRLTEVEAYLPNNDPACHAFRGPTRRNAAMFGPPGCVYVYLSYGIHVLLNLVCDRENVGSAVLVRSFEPVGDTSVLHLNRKTNRRAVLRKKEVLDGDLQYLGLRGTGGANDSSGERHWLSCGPGRVGDALGLGLDLNGLLLGKHSGLYVIDDGNAPRVARTTRVGVSRGAELPLRFYALDSPFVTHRRREVSGGQEA